MAYPLTLSELAGRRVLLAGGGAVAAQKLPALLQAGARVHLVALSLEPEVHPFLDALDRIEERRAVPADVEGVALVIAATDDRATNHALARAARARGVLVNVVDDPAASTFFAPAIVRRGPVTLAVSTAGRSPLLAARLRRLLEALLPESLSAVGELFARLRAGGLGGLARRDALLRALADVELGALVEGGDLGRAHARAEILLADRPDPFPPGSVVVAGAGPGAADLLTERAIDRLARAEVVLHDALVEPAVLARARSGARLLNVGRRAACAGPQRPWTDPERLAALLVAEARIGRRVLRLHAGDPLVFGRGGEELTALEAAGVPYELVPGVSAPLAAAAAARVPLTERGVARGFTVRTGHGASGPTRAELPRREETAVVLMGLGALAQVVQGLLAEGYPPDTPALAVSRASRPDERVVAATLTTLAERVHAAGLESPTTLIVGQVGRRRVGEERAACAA